METLLVWMKEMLNEPETHTVLTVIHHPKGLWGIVHSPKRIYAANLNQQGKEKTKPTKPAIKRTANSIDKKQYGHQRRQARHTA